MAYKDIHDETAHPNAAAEERAKASIRLAGAPADDLIAGTIAFPVPGSSWVFTIALPWVNGALVLALAQVFLSGVTQWLAVVGSPAVLIAIAALVPAAKRRPVYLAVTQDEFTCYRVPKMTWQPAAAEVLFRAPASAVRIYGRRDKKGKCWTIRISRDRGAKGRRLQLTVDRSWYRELQDVMAALQRAGAEVQPALLGITAGLA